MPRRHSRPLPASACPRKSVLKDLRSICSKNFNVITCINFIMMFVYYRIFVTGSAHVRDTFATSLSVAGLTSGIMIIGCLLGRFICGNLINIAGCHLLLACGLLLLDIPLHI